MEKKDFMILKDLKTGNWITIGQRDAVICTIYDDAPNNKVEVVYLDRDRAINEDAHYINGNWEFVSNSPCGGYADKYKRLSEYVAILRSGKRYL